MGSLCPDSAPATAGLVVTATAPFRRGRTLSGDGE
jgi:hypothetical protein